MFYTDPEIEKLRMQNEKLKKENAKLKRATIKLQECEENLEQIHCIAHATLYPNLLQMD